VRVAGEVDEVEGVGERFVGDVRAADRAALGHEFADREAFLEVDRGRRAGHGDALPGGLGAARQFGAVDADAAARDLEPGAEREQERGTPGARGPGQDAQRPRPRVQVHVGDHGPGETADRDPFGDDLHSTRCCHASARPPRTYKT
jgi:hypothetical protein